ncbi:MAG: sigma-70 family RNA polymerase sigma factor [Muribaculaceae bacterium]|nr:sigma-70 family RNA polymerase sigma factor [Muribaculaceae bacterium]
MKTKTDIDEILQRCRMGNEGALKWLYSHYHERLLSISRRYVEDAEAARDIEHDAWIMIFTTLDSLHSSTKLEAWMGSIVRNMALNYLKQNRSHQRIPIDNSIDLAIEPSNEILPEISIPIVLEMVGHLPQGYQQVFRLKTFEGLSHREIGELLGITESSSRSQLSRAKQQLQEMVKHHWALLATLLALILPMSIYLTNNNETKKTPSEKKQITSRRQLTTTPGTLQSATLSTNQPGFRSTTTCNVSAIGNQQVSTTITSNEQTSVLTSYDIPATSIEGLKWQASSIPAAPTVAPSLQQRQQQTLSNQDKSHRRWNLHLAYGGAPNSTASVTDNFLSVINFAAGETQRAMKLYTWSDYYNYLNDNAELMDSIDAMAMKQIADRHAQSSPEIQEEIDDKMPLSETKHHERPRTVQLSLSMPLSQRWSLSSGLGFTWMKSTFETDNGNDNDITRRTQRLYYLNVPLGVTYNIWQHRRWTVYTSGSVHLDIPLRGRETTQYIYTGKYPHAPGDSLVFPTTHATVKAPWQWSVGASVGVQYKLLPHVNAYFEPGFRYYIPTGSPIETYRTAHPFDVALPFGIRIVP